MKKIANSVLKGVLVLFLFTGGSIALSTAGATTVNEAQATVSPNQVYEYLVSNGYTVYNIYPGPKFDWYARTSLNGVQYLTLVHCSETCIISQGDVAL